VRVEVNAPLRGLFAMYRNIRKHSTRFPNDFASSTVVLHPSNKDGFNTATLQAIRPIK
jgi:hypothetical protein